MPEEQLREDQSDLANWTRGDRKARFEQTAQRHAGLSQFAAPFLSRMRFVDEQGEGASPTLSARRAYREHRAAGRRGPPPDVSLDFAPPALQPLIRRNGLTDRRRWESALFLKVRDEIRPATSPSRARRTSAASRPSSCPLPSGSGSARRFWARTGFPVNSGAAVEHLKVRLSDTFDRFLDGVADNRQVAFDDGWRLKTDPAEPPEPAQSDRLAELHRWLDSRSRSIRLADLLIEVENDLGFSVHFQQPGEPVDPGEVCALLAAILAHGCNLGLYTMEKVAPDIAYRRLKNVSDWRLVEENQRAALAAIVMVVSPASTPPDYWGDGTTSVSDGLTLDGRHRAMRLCPPARAAAPARALQVPAAVERRYTRPVYLVGCHSPTPPPPRRPAHGGHPATHSTSASASRRSSSPSRKRDNAQQHETQSKHPNIRVPRSQGNQPARKMQCRVVAT